MRIIKFGLIICLIGFFLQACKTKEEEEIVYDNQANIGSEKMIPTTLYANKFVDGYSLFFMDSHFSVDISLNDTISGEYLISGDTLTNNGLSATLNFTGLAWGGLHIAKEGSISLTVLDKGNIKGTYWANCKSISTNYIEKCEGRFKLTSERVKDKTKASPLQDIDGNNYKTVLIGHQIWMAENLKTTHFADGTAIDLVTSDAQWGSIGDQQHMSYYSMNPHKEYGAVYTYGAAIKKGLPDDTRQGVCPDGWHLPSSSEWVGLFEFIKDKGFEKEEGKILKSEDGWINNGNGTNLYGFLGLPAGFRNAKTGVFSDTGRVAWWWSYGHDLSKGAADIIELRYDNSTYNRFRTSFSSGLSVRCIKD